MRHLISTTSGPLLSRLGTEAGARVLRDAGFEAMDYGIQAYANFAYSSRHEGDSLFEKPDAEVLAFFREQSAVLREVGIAVGQTHAPFPSNRLTETSISQEEHHFRLARLSVRITRELGCDYMVLHPAFNNHIPYDGRPDIAADHWEKNRVFYLSLLSEARECGVTVLLENMWGRIFQTVPIFPSAISHAPEFCEWIDRLNEEAGEERFGACLDTGHALLTGDDPAAMVRALGGRLKALHMHDTKPDADLHTAPFDGTCDWVSLAAALREVGYAGTLNFETGSFSNRRPDALLPACTEFLAASARWLRTLVDGE